jgi:hypothetical protein
VRLVAAILCWLVATAALAVAVPAGWAQRNLIDADGYAALAYSAARDPVLQDAMASELSTQARVIARNRGYPVNDGAVRAAATAYTASSAFPSQFADVNRTAHAWLFTNAVRQNDGQWEIDLAPMLSNTSLRETLSNFRVEVPSTVTVPVTQDTATTLRPGRLSLLATWGPWVSLAAAVLAGVAAFLTLAVVGKRGKALAALGVSALLVGGVGWAALEVCRRYIGNALNQTTGNVRTIADVMVANAEAGLHHWLNLTLAAGGALVVFGVIVTVLGAALRGKQGR